MSDQGATKAERFADALPSEIGLLRSPLMGWCLWYSTSSRAAPDARYVDVGLLDDAEVINDLLEADLNETYQALLTKKAELAGVMRAFGPMKARLAKVEADLDASLARVSLLEAALDEAAPYVPETDGPATRAMEAATFTYNGINQIITAAGEEIWIGLDGALPTFSAPPGSLGRPKVGAGNG